MRLFMEENGSYVFRKANASRTSKVFTVAMAFSALVTVAVAAVLYLVMKKTGNTEQLYIIPLVLFLILPADMLVLVMLRKRFGRAGTIRIDYMKGVIDSGEGTGGISTADIQRVELDAGGSPAAGVTFFGGGYQLMAVTGSGTVRLAGFRSRQEAREVGEELASILSVDLRESG